MENSVNQRVRQLMEKERLNPNSFSAKIGVTRSTISSMFDKGTEPGCQTITAILSAYPSLSAEWLLRGDGNMFKDENVSSVNGNGNNIVNGDGNSNINQTQGVGIGKGLYTKLVKAIMRGCPSEEEQDKIIEELEKYTNN